MGGEGDGDAPGGACLTPEERAAIVDYLSATLKPGARIFINLAPATDLARLLEIAVAEAKRIAGHRNDQGPFTSVEDVRRVPGVDAARMTPRRDLEF